MIRNPWPPPKARVSEETAFQTLPLSLRSLRDLTPESPIEVRLPPKTLTIPPKDPTLLPTKLTVSLRDLTLENPSHQRLPYSVRVTATLEINMRSIAASV